MEKTCLCGYRRDTASPFATRFYHSYLTTSRGRSEGWSVNSVVVVISAAAILQSHLAARGGRIFSAYFSVNCLLHISINYMENVTDLYAHAQTVDTRRSSPIFQAPGYEASTTVFRLVPFTLDLIGASLSEPHTSGTALQKCVHACLQPYTVNFKCVF